MKTLMVLVALLFVGGCEYQAAPCDGGIPVSDAQVSDDAQVPDCSCVGGKYITPDGTEGSIEISVLDRCPEELPEVYVPMQPFYSAHPSYTWTFNPAWILSCE